MDRWHFAWLRVSRTRLFVAITVPALIGASTAYWRDSFNAAAFALVLIGLMLAGVGNLLLTDYANSLGFKSAPGLLRKYVHLEAVSGGGGGSVVVDGSAGPAPGRAPGASPPVGSLTPTDMPPARTLAAGIGTLAVACTIGTYFAFTRGLPVTAFVLAGLVASVLYVMPPFPYSYFATAFLPPLISLGTYYVLTDSLAVAPALAAGPTALLAAGVIYTYRVIYLDQNRFRVRMLARWLSSFCSVAAVLLLVLPALRVLPVTAAIALIPFPLAYFAQRAALQRPLDYVPATSYGVMLHASSGVLLAVGIALGRLG